MKKSKCDECGQSGLEWGYSKRITSGVVQGRLNTNDVEVLFYLSCQSCSATLKIVGCDDVVNILNQNENEL